MEFGERLKELRKEKGRSQKEFGKIFGLSESAIGMYERNERTPDLEMIKKIADFFEVSVDYLIGRSDEELTESEKTLWEDAETLSIEEIQKKHTLTIDGRPATKEEINGVIAFIRSLRSME